MRCYYHREREAVGLCRACGKGLCDDCQTDLGQGLACKDRCEENVRDLIALVEHNIRVMPMAVASLRWNRRVWVGAGFFLLAPGAIFTALGMLDRRAPPGLILLGASLCVFGLLAFVLAWRLPGVPKSRNGAEPLPSADRPRD
jgi:hypothetical protein